jgi:predicted alpha/beta superfamily hydrolase
MNRILLCVFLLGCLAPMAVGDESESSAPSPAVIRNSASYVLDAEKIDQRFRIDVALPSSYGEGDRRYPVVYVTDGGGNFPIVVGNLRMLTLGREMPEVLVVGIGYDGIDVARILRVRARDLTPTIRESERERESEEVLSGGASDFVDFIENELKPFINDNYRTDADNETLIGYSLGGLFGLHVLFNHTDSFDKYIIGSPSIWWDDTVSFDYEADYAQNHQDLAKRVFMSTGGLEERPADDSRMVTNMVKMFQRLRSRHYASLDIDHHVFEGETHMSCMGTAFSRGLRFVFRDEPSATSELEPEETE